MKSINKTHFSVVLALVAAVSLAGCRGHHGRMTPEKAEKYASAWLDDALDDLDATPEQREKIQALKSPLIRDGLALHKEGKSVHAELFREWKAATPDSARVHQLIDGHVDQIRALAHRIGDAVITVHGVLTPAQRAEVTEEVEDHFDHFAR